MVQKYSPAAIGLGGNIGSPAGSPAATLVAAIAALATAGARPMAISRFFRTPAYPPGSGPDFVNAAALLDSPWSPADLLEKLQSVENSLGRVRESRWGARTIDLDLLFSGDAVLPDIDTQKKWTTLDPDSQRVVAPEQLILPHPRLQDRAFVLIPLADISPLWRHPILGQTVTEMADALPEGVKGAIRPL